MRSPRRWSRTSPPEPPDKAGPPQADKGPVDGLRGLAPRRDGNSATAACLALPLRAAAFPMGIMQSHAIDLLDTLSIGILLGALLVLAGIMSSLIATRFGAPLLL